MLDIEKLTARLVAAVSELPAHADDEPTEHVETVEHAEEQKETAARPLVGNVTPTNFFRHPDAHPIVLDLLLLKKYGPDFLVWETETLFYRIPQDFKSEVSDLNMAKIQACRTLHLVDTFWQRWEVFGWVTMALNGLFPDFDTMQIPTIAQAAISVYMAKQVRDDVDWSSEVRAYLAQVFKFEGIFYPLEPLNFVVVEHDGYVVNVPAIAEEWPKVRASRQLAYKESIQHEQLRRLLLVQEALDENRALLRSQLPLVGHV